LLNKYATSDEIGLIFCIHGLYFMTEHFHHLPEVLFHY